MAPVDAFLAISKLLTELTERIKDGKTSALVQQVQSNYEAIQASYFSAEKRALERQQELVRIVTDHAELQRKLRETQDAHVQEIAALKESYEKQITELQSVIAGLKRTENETGSDVARSLQ
ncbi:MAG: hypothetical protein DME18_10105 [Verrucomicrobia bacterium]|nr:MAG: hypothetical protein DME18_10105 [Verrucomicrobiota bacterium]